MLRPVFSSLIAAALLVGLGLFNSCEKPTQAPSQGIGELELYTFSPDRRHFLGNARPFRLDPGTSLEEALGRFGEHLAETYFQRTYTEEVTNIHFDVVGIDEIGVPSSPLRVATVNMVDPDEYGMKYFFQGSAGGQTTFYILAATFLQPHLDPPLIDGLVLLYNGELLPELDHINLRGILTPRLVQHVTKRAIDGSTM
ncbi:MAG: hypothetical protein JRI71_04950 [Deltaproteobacteria bacterium]|nr:hypothetical protein [Deltaproteobacteria bacterium]MBW2076888.1 hypothetical protein [Deltaproteobacteria bacterium]MBW2309982.1 hypothetical protein [Deltaproteobacteria bacterium]